MTAKRSGNKRPRRNDLLLLRQNEEEWWMDGWILDREKNFHTLSQAKKREKRLVSASERRRNRAEWTTAWCVIPFKTNFHPDLLFSSAEERKSAAKRFVGRWNVFGLFQEIRALQSPERDWDLKLQQIERKRRRREKATANSASSTTKEKKERFVTTSAPFRPDDILLPNRRRRRKGTSCVRAFTHSHGYIYVNRIIHSGLPWIKFSLLHMCDVRPRRGRSSEQSELLATTTDRRPKIWLYNNQRILWAL